MAEQVNLSESQLKTALQSGQLSSFTWLPDTYEHFAIPRAYWATEISCLSGKIFSFPAEQIIPPQFVDRPIVIRRRDWLAWLATIGLELAELVATPFDLSVGRMIPQPDSVDPSVRIELSPWLSTLQSLGLIATGSPADVCYLGELQAERRDEMALTIAFAYLQIHVAKNCCQCNAQGLPESVRPGLCTCTGEAGRRLLEAIRVGTVVPVRTSPRGSQTVSFHDLAGVGVSRNAEDWIAAGLDLQFSAAEVSVAFHTFSPASLETGSDDSGFQFRTGDAGRPSKSAHLYLAEHERRCTDRTAITKVADEAQALLEWLRKNHSEYPPPTAKTIKNRIASRHRAYNVGA